SDHGDEADWRIPASVALGATAYETRTRYDALDRVVWQALPDGTERTTRFIAMGAVSEQRISAADGTIADTAVLHDCVYDADGRRTSAVLGNGVELART